MQEITINTQDTKDSTEAVSSEATTQIESLKLEWRADGQLWATQNGKDTVVYVHCCFPWSEPDRYISIRDGDGIEVALINRLNILDERSREAVEKGLTEASFFLEIVKVLALEKDYEMRCWKVETRQGYRTFQTKLDDWPLMLPNRGLLIRDVSGDLFLIKDPDAMDEKSQKMLWAFVR